MNDRLYLLKIKMLDIEPEIWRRFVVPADLRLDELHEVIQMIMGWDNYHLYEFIFAKKRYAQHEDFEENWLECSEYRLDDLVKRKGQKIIYIYDFGDGWEHELVVEDSRYENSKLKMPVVCLEGKRACPPEDVGGAGGYFALSEAMEDPNHEEHEYFMEFLGEEYDSEKFDIKAVNLALKEYIQ